MDTATLHNAITTPDGCLKEVTRIEIEVLGGRTLRWTLWNGEVRLCSLSARPGDIRPMLESSGAILRTMTGIRPVEEDDAGGRMY